MYLKALMSLTPENIPFSVITGFRQLERPNHESEESMIDNFANTKRKLDFSDPHLLDEMTPDKPKPV